MNPQNRQAIDSIFTRLAEIEKTGPARDGEAEALIHSRLSEQPGSAYYLAQTVIVQEQALQAAQQKIQTLEQRASAQTAASTSPARGLGYGFGRGSAEVPAPEMDDAASANAGFGSRAMATSGHGGGLGQRLGFDGQGNNAGQQARPAGGGGFMAGAMQTALGVAGGMMLGNMLSGLFANSAEAAQGTAAETGDQNAVAESGMEDSPAQMDGWNDSADFNDGGFDDV